MKPSNLYLLLMFCFFFSFLSAQDLKINEYQKCIVKKPKEFKFIFQLDNRQALGFHKSRDLSGLTIGVEQNEVHDVGIGFYSNLNPNGFRAQYQRGDKNWDLRTEFSYTTLFYQYAFVHNAKWELAIPFHLGSGNARVQVVKEGSNELVLNQETGEALLNAKGLKFSIGEIGFDGQYKVHKWVGLGAGIAYRFLLAGDENQKKLFNGATYELKLKFFFGEIYKSIRYAQSYEGVYNRKNK